ncbi:hypothetical protein [Marinomonas arctica]|uniref:hypothetical protein n=1 Tax=Marinomonas arctica TaxID=383750 RepID=UPI000DBA3493|nr:hypothetical protein [Marinomonas arctica]MCS7486521.1 hypothetical protein [Marinomonas sp. BSi20414]GGN31035.1 hypothetical protein GCM10011350_24350 [Marinomonas arctica]
MKNRVGIFRSIDWFRDKQATHLKASHSKNNLGLDESFKALADELVSFLSTQSISHNSIDFRLFFI